MLTFVEQPSQGEDVEGPRGQHQRDARQDEGPVHATAEVGYLQCRGGLEHLPTTEWPSEVQAGCHKVAV